MKNVLFATSALVSIAGMAMADVSLSGEAAMGITYSDYSLKAGGTEIDSDDSTEFYNDFDVSFTLSGETDNGLTFGAALDLSDAVSDGTVNGSNSVFVSGSFGTLSMGDVDGGYDKALSELPSGGLNDEADNASGASGLDGYADGEVLRYDYSISGVTLSASLELAEDGVHKGFEPNNFPGGITGYYDIDNIYGVGAAWSGEFSGMTVDLGLGYQTADTTPTSALPASCDPMTGDEACLSVGDGTHNLFGASAVLGFGSVSATLLYENHQFPSDADVGDINRYGLGVEYGMGAITVGGGYEREEWDDVWDKDLFQAFMTYDLTGGAEFVVAAGYEEYDFSATGIDAKLENTYAGAGLAFSF